MTRSDIDNDLARLLGPDAIPDEERSSILARMADDDDAMSQLADAAAVLRELEAEDGIVVLDETAHGEPRRVHEAEPARDAKVVTPPPSSRPAWRRPPARWLAMAAMLAGVLLIVPLSVGRRSPAGPAEFAMLLDSRRLPERWNDTPGFNGTRSGRESLVEQARAARLGALHVRLELAVAARQIEETSDVSRGIAASLVDVTAGGTVSHIYSDIAARPDQPRDSLARLLRDGREGVAMLMDEEYFALGAWAEAARLAAHGRDMAFFRARASRRMLHRAASIASRDDSTRMSVDALRAAGQADAEPDWPGLQVHATRLLGYLASNRYSGTPGEEISFVAVAAFGRRVLSVGWNRPPHSQPAGSYGARSARHPSFVEDKTNG